jgi:hypothetical protein
VLRGIAVEGDERVMQRVGARRIHGVARFDARTDDRGDGAVALDVKTHLLLLAWYQVSGVRIQESARRSQRPASVAVADFRSWAR